MRYRKFQADHLFTGTEIRETPSTLITTQDGTIEAIIPSSEAGDGVEIYQGLISPGFINCHCHLELSHLKGLIPEKTGMVDFLLSVIKQRNFPTEVIQQAIIDAEREMLDKGIVAVGDICNTPDTLAQKKRGNLYYHNFIEATGFIETAAEQRFLSTKAIFEQFAAQYALPVESNSLVPHAPYSVSGALFKKIASFPGNHLLSIHNQESEAENDFNLSGTGDFLRLYKALGVELNSFNPPGTRTLEHTLTHFYNNQSLILVHNVATTEADFDSLRSRPEDKKVDLYWCLCPNANLYISQKMPPMDLLLAQQCSIVIGTDSLASNHRLDLLEELKTLQQYFPFLETATLLQWATLQGAKALQLESIAGSFEKGKQPGIVLLENMEGKQFGKKATAQRIL